jgi:hypothetical protein
MDAGVGSADSSIVDRITTGVDVTADNTTHRLMSPRTRRARQFQLHPLGPAIRRP